MSSSPTSFYSKMSISSPYQQQMFLGATRSGSGSAAPSAPRSSTIHIGSQNQNFNIPPPPPPSISNMFSHPPPPGNFYGSGLSPPPPPTMSSFSIPQNNLFSASIQSSSISSKGPPIPPPLAPSTAQYMQQDSKKSTTFNQLFGLMGAKSSG